MRTSIFRAALRVMLAALTTSSAVAGVRGRPINLRSPAPASHCPAQSSSGDTAVDTNPVPIMMPVAAQPMMTMYCSGVEAGMYHFPYYSYRRPWYYPGQPSFQRSTDYVW